jgi:integrase/recombinase XerD
MSMRKRYLRVYKQSDESQMRRISPLIKLPAGKFNPDAQDKAIILLLFKTGIRCNELLSLDTQDVDIKEKTTRLKPTAKRSNRIVYFDEGAAEVLMRWLKARESRNKNGSSAIFLSHREQRS